MTDLEALRRDAEAEPRNQSLQAALGRAEARRGIRGRRVLLYLVAWTTRQGRRRTKKHVAIHVYRETIQGRRLLRAETVCRMEPWHLNTTKVAGEDAIDCKHCREVLRLGPRGKAPRLEELPLWQQWRRP